MCRGCGEEKPLEEYGVDKRATDGRKSRCKVCLRAEDREYSKRPEAREKGRQRQRRYAQRHRPRLLEMRKGYYHRDRDKNLALMKVWREANPEKVKVAQRRWQQANRDRKAELERQRLARKREAFVEDIDVEALITAHGNVCGICGDPIEEPFQVDHIIPLAAGGEHSQANAQLAHPLCNRQKGARTNYLAAQLYERAEKR